MFYFLGTNKNPMPESNAVIAPTRQAMPISPNIKHPIKIPSKPTKISNTPMIFTPIPPLFIGCIARSARISFPGVIHPGQICA